MRLLAEKRLADIDQITRRFPDGRKGLEAVDRKELIERVRRRSIMVIDVRPGGEFQAGYIPGAISVPLKELESNLAEFPRNKGTVAYCRSPYCVQAIQAVEALHANGCRALRLEDGVQDRRARGLDVATGKEA